jgi:hypothetical protein
MAARSVSMPVLVAAVLVLVLVVGGLAWHFFGPNTGSGRGRPLTAEEKANADWLSQKAKETGGDFSKLSQEDQRRLFAQHGPQAPFVLRQAAHPVKIGP